MYINSFSYIYNYKVDPYAKHHHLDKILHFNHLILNHVFQNWTTCEKGKSLQIIIKNDENVNNHSQRGTQLLIPYNNTILCTLHMQLCWFKSWNKIDTKNSPKYETSNFLLLLKVLYLKENIFKEHHIGTFNPCGSFGLNIDTHSY